MLIPSVVAVVLWLIASGYLVFTGFYDREVASSVRTVSIPAVTGLSSIQRERSLSIAYLTDRVKGPQGLLDQRRQTDQRLSTFRTAADSALALAPASIKTRWKALSDYLDQLPTIRSMIDLGSTDRQHVYDFYNRLLDSATSLFDTQARVVPDVTATQGGIAATDTFRVSDLMSRAGSVIAGAFGSRGLSRDEYLEFVGMVGAYHAQLTNVAPHFRPNVRKRYEGIVADASWKDLVAAENALIAAGPWRGDVPHGLPVNAVNWEGLTTKVSDDLVNLTIAQADEVSAEALRTGNNQLLTALLGSLIALAIAVGAILWAIRQSQALVDRALSVRLAKLGGDAATVVEQQLPDIMDRLRRREKVDLGVELPRRDYGRDEIGQLADVLNASMKAAVGAAAEEAATRAASIAMLMGVARRPQRPLQRGLQVIEDLQSRVGDEKLLAELFDINHQLAQTRRFLENLIILAGGQTGRRFHKPVLVRRVLLAASAETQQYQRVTIRRTVDVALVGSVVAGTTHLLAELLDNALAFSSPQSQVWVSCSQTRQGVVVEIEDAGVGMLREDLERANELLATAPTPDVTALKDGSQVGFWVVAELAKRSGIQVTLRTSAYGGLLAIVLVPDRLVVSDADLSTADVADAAPGPLTAGAAPVVAARAADTTGSAQLVPNLQTSEGRRTDSGNGMTNDHHPNGTSADRPRTDPSPSRIVNASLPGPRSAAARAPLPERRPQAHLAPELRDGAPADADPRETEGPARSPEETRERLARYQRGWRAGSSAGRHGNINQE